MAAVHPRKQKCKSRLRLQKPGATMAIPVPTRCSSTVCTFWTDIDKMAPHDGVSYTSTAEDPYLRALRQLSATHRPSLDNIPLERPTSSDASKQRPSNAATGRNPADTTGREIGRRYHRRADGGVDIEFVDVSAHQHHGHSTVNKVRPAIGIERHPAAVTGAVCPKQESREARRSRWSRWHTSSKMKEQLRVTNGSTEAPAA